MRMYSDTKNCWKSTIRNKLPATESTIKNTSVNNRPGEAYHKYFSSQKASAPTRIGRVPEGNGKASIK